jgi:hypothetical protein
VKRGPSRTSYINAISTASAVERSAASETCSEVSGALTCRSVAAFQAGYSANRPSILCCNYWRGGEARNSLPLPACNLRHGQPLELPAPSLIPRRTHRSAGFAWTAPARSSCHAAAPGTSRRIDTAPLLLLPLLRPVNAHTASRPTCCDRRSAHPKCLARWQLQSAGSRCACHSCPPMILSSCFALLCLVREQEERRLVALNAQRQLMVCCCCRRYQPVSAQVRRRHWHANPPSCTAGVSLLLFAQKGDALRVLRRTAARLERHADAAVRSQRPCRHECEL